MYIKRQELLLLLVQLKKTQFEVCLGKHIQIPPNHSLHPESTADLKGWILRASGSMQNPVWPGRERVVLNQGEQVRMKAALVVFREKANPANISRIYQDYAM